jgi:subtilisin family serine protease/bacillopeptidase F (M6 metalloprotease family)
MMFTKSKLFGCAAALLILLILLPTVHSADAQEEQKAKVAPGLAVQLSAAKPTEYVTAIVRVLGRPNLRLLRGDRPAVFSEMRAVHRQSQNALVQSLERPEVKAKVKKIRRFWIDNLVLVRATPDIIADIAARPDVIEVFENFTVTVPPRPDTPQHPNLGLGENQLWDHIAHIGAKQVWTTYGFDGTGVVVGGLDTGVDIAHPDIAGKMINNSPGDPTYPGGWAEFDADGNIIPGSVPHDSDQHGTHTTGTMIGGNASGWDVGVAPGAQLMHGLVIPGGSGSFAQVAAGMEWIIDPDSDPLTDDGADVVNMSLGATGTHSAMIVPTDNMVAANVFPSFSIGNSGPSPNTTGSPGNVPSAYGVGATDSMDVIAGFSSRGPVTWNDPPYVGTWIKPDISAPGVQIYSTIPGGGWAWTDPFGDWSGTSMAAPHVSGTVALMLQANPSMTVDVTKQLLEQTAIDLGAPGMDNDYGHGRVNAFGAVTAALAGVGTLEGTIYSSGGGTVENAKILITDTGQRVYSDEFGNYTMQLVAGDHSVEVSRFGYETYTTTASVIADATTTLDVALTQLPSGTIAGYVTDGDTGDGIATDITVKLGGEAVVWTSTDPSTGEYSIVLPVGTYDLIFSPVFPYPVTLRNGVEVYEATTTPLDVELSGAQVLIVDDDKGAGYEAYFQSAVLAAGRSYLKVSTPPTAADMALFETVVWFTGNDYTTTLTTDDQANIAAYLDGGGRLFLTGQDIGYDIRTSDFYADYLHATYVQDDVGLGGVLGDPASPVGYGFAFEIQGGSGANNQGYPSEIDVLYPALPAFLYDETVPAGAVTGHDMGKGQIESDGISSSGTAGLSVDNGTYKLVYLAFGFEAIADETSRNNVMGRILDWLLGYPKITHTPLGDTEDTVNDYHVTALITSDYFTLDPSSFAVVYNAGAGDVVVPMTATGVADEYEAYIPAQDIDTEVYYYITASDVEGHTSTHPIGAPMNMHMFTVGWDDVYPEVVHQRYYNTNDLDGPYEICALVTDNIGVEAVYLLYSLNGGMFHRVEMTMGEGGMYCGAIPGPSEVGDVYEYHILAMDESYHGNATRVPATGEYSFEIVEYFLWDFEPDDGGFTQLGDVWEWGTPTSGPGAANSGVNVWATVLDGTYPNSANATLDIPPITLAASKPYAMLSIWHWYEIEGAYTRYDGGNVKVSADGGMTWTVITPLGGYDGTASTSNAGIPGELCFSGYDDMFWQKELFDLTPYVGSDVIVRFHFGSDGSVYKAGWYVDDVMIRSTDVDDVPPIISGTEVPPSTFDTAGPYEVTTNVVDFLGTVAGVSLFYSTDDGMSWTEVAMAPGTGDEYSASIPGQPSGSRIKLYIGATDDSANESVDPTGAPADAYEFAILPSADILVMQMSSSATSLEMFREALEANDHEADYWYQPSQGWLGLSELALYKVIIIDETYSLTTTEKNDVAAYLEGGSLGAKRRLFILGRNLSYYSSNRPWIEEYMRAAYVQSDPGWRELTGYPGEYIGADETFVISGYSPDEVQRSTSYPGGELVYQYTGPGSTLPTREELREEHEKMGDEWDGVVPHDPNTTDAGAGIKYNSDTYRSVYFAFNFNYIQEPENRAGIMDRAIAWLSAPDIVHMPLYDTEDTLSAYAVVAEVYSATLDPSRVNLTYDVGMGAVTVQMMPTGNPDEYAADIPPQGFGTTVNYYISAANTDGTTSYHPEGAPTHQHTFEVTADNQPPVIVHVPLGNTASQAGPYVVEATITDNVGVDPAGVTLTYNKNGGTNTTIPMTNVSGDLYSADIPGPAVLGDVFSYYILARDIAEIPNTAREPASGYHSFEVVDYYAWDFEASDGGFSTTGPDWEWGDPTSGPEDAYSGVNVWATVLDGNYSSSSDSRLETPVITVPDSSPYAALSYWQWYYIEGYSPYDGGNVKISTDGGSSWTIIYPDIGYDDIARSYNAGIPGEECFTGYDSDFWHKVTFDLTPYKGQSVIIRWHFGSDSSVQKVGWYIDDVRIEGVSDTEAPVIVSTDVPASTFDTAGPYTVTSTVVDALSGVATVTLNYSTDDGSTWTPVSMMPAGGDDYSGDIPGQDSGTRIKLYVEASDNAANSSVDPAGAPAVTYEFGIMPSGDYLVLLGGGSHTSPAMWQLAFSAAGRTADIWDWDDLGLPTLEILQAYTGVIVDESWYFDTYQQALLASYLDADVGNLNQIWFLGRDLSYGSSARPFMEQYTGAAYVKDSPGWYQLTSTPGDPIGADETFVISGSYPDELRLSTTYTGANIVYKYSGLGSSLDAFGTENDARESFEKADKDWDPRLWPMVPSGPDSAAAVRYVGPHHASVYFAFNFSYIQEETRRAAVLDRALAWLAIASKGVLGADLAERDRLDTPEIPDRLTLWQNYPNPFNPVTTIQFGIPKGVSGPVQLRIYNVKGELVKTIYEGRKAPGIYRFEWNGRNNRGVNVTSGIYFCRFIAEDVRLTKKMVLLR